MSKPAREDMILLKYAFCDKGVEKKTTAGYEFKSHKIDMHDLGLLVLSEHLYLSGMWCGIAPRPKSQKTSV